MMWSEYWSSATPGLLIIICDQCEWSSALCNRIIGTIIQTNFNKDKPKKRCFISVIGYGAEVKELCSGFLEDLYNNPIRIEKRYQKVSDGNGGLVDVSFINPIWVDPIKAYQANRAIDGLMMAKLLVEDWIADHPVSCRPVILDLGCGLRNLNGSLRNDNCLVFGVYEDTPVTGELYDCIPQDWLDSVYNIEGCPTECTFNASMMPGLVHLLFPGGQPSFRIVNGKHILWCDET